LKYVIFVLISVAGLFASSSLGAGQVGATARTQAGASQARSDKYSNEPYVIEKYTTTYRFETDGSQKRTIFARVRIQSALAAQKFSHLAFNYDASSGSLDFELVRILRAKDLQEISTASAKDAPAEFTRDAAAYGFYRQKTIEIPSLQTGHILEYQIVSHGRPLATAQAWIKHTFLTDAITLDEELIVDAPKSHTPAIRSPRFAYAADSAAPADRILYRWKHANLALPADPESAGTGSQQKTAKVADVTLTTFRTWDEVAKWYAAEIATQSDSSSEVTAKTKELARDGISEEQKVRSIYNFVSQEIREVDLETSSAARSSLHPAQLLSQGYASGADKEILLIAMLRAAGMHADLGTICDSGTFDPAFPSPTQFDRNVAAVLLDGKIVWLDPSSGVAPFQFLPASLRNKSALVVAAAGTGRIARTPADPPFPSTQRVQITGNVTELGKLSAHVRYELRGDNEFVLRLAFRKTPESQWKELAQTILTLDGLHGKILQVKPTTLTQTDEPFALDVEYAQSDFLDWSSERTRAPLPLLAIGVPDAPKKSSAAIDLGSPLRVTAELKVTFPEKFKVRAPVAIAVSREYADFKSSYDFSGGILTAERLLDFKERSVPAANSSDYVSFSRAVSADQAQPLLIENANASSLSIPSNATAEDLYDAGSTALSANNSRSAIPLLQKLVELQKDYPQAWNQLGLAYLRSQQLDLAAQAFEKQLEIDPRDAQAHNYLGLAWEEQHKTAEAIGAFRQQIAIDPLDKVAHEALGNLYLAQREYSEALTELDKAAILSPEKSSLQISLGDVYLNLGKNEPARTAFNKAIALSPTNPAIRNAVARDLADHKTDLDTAQKYAETAIATVKIVTPDDFTRVPPDLFTHEARLATYWDTLGWVYFQKGDFENAQRFSEASWDLNPSGENAFHLGRLYEARHEKDKAVHTYALALTASDPDAEAQARLTLLLGGNAQIPDLLVRTRAGAETQVFSVPNPAKSEGAADFLLLISQPSTSTAHTRATVVRFVAGKEELRSATQRVGAIDFGRMLPTAEKLVRTGRLVCPQSSAECTFTLLPLGEPLSQSAQ
jgi:tetratricopeptide (TPR) repeat protein